MYKDVLRERIHRRDRDAQPEHQDTWAAAKMIFSISPDRITVHSTNTSRIANASPTAASTGADLNESDHLGLRSHPRTHEGHCRPCSARPRPCEIELSGQVIYHNAKRQISTGRSSSSSWMENSASSLSSTGHYATPVIHFNKAKEKGRPFSYHVYGKAVTAVTVDCLRGTYEIDLVKIVHDFGTSMNLDIDLGQVEGGLVQGIGLMTIEELPVSPNGKSVLRLSLGFIRFRISISPPRPSK